MSLLERIESAEYVPSDAINRVQAFRRSLYTKKKIAGVEKPHKPEIPLAKPVENHDRDWLSVSSDDHFIEIPKTRVTLAQIKSETAIKYRVTEHDIDSPCRNAKTAQARFEVFWRARRETNLSLPAIGFRCNRDHTTVLNGIRKYDLMRDAKAGCEASREKVTRYDLDMVIGG